MPVEFKFDVEALNGHHESQLLNYMFLLGLSEGKLINFSPPSVEHRFVSSTVTQPDRFSYTIDDKDWDEACSGGKKIKRMTQGLLTDLGAYLEIELYKTILYNLLGGEEDLLRPMAISVEGRVIGYQKFHLIDQNISQHISSTIRNVQQYRQQLLRSFKHTELTRIHWVNFSRNRIVLTTLRK